MNFFSSLFLLLAPGVMASFNIVGLGDSYMSGNGAGGIEGPDDCYRSPNTWAEQFSDLIGGNFLNRGCSDGRIADIQNSRFMGYDGAVAITDGVCDAPDFPPEEFYTNPEYGSCPRYLMPQNEWINEAVDLVLVAVGGNDLGFEQVVRKCFIFGQRSRDECVANMDYARNTIPTAKADLIEALLAIETRMNTEAKVIVMSHPYITLNTAYVNDCCGFSGDNWDIVTGLRQLGDTIEASQLDAVQEANNAAGREFVYLYDQAKALFEGHEPHPRATVSNPNRWIHECLTDMSQNSWHLNPTGHNQLALSMDAFVKDLLGITTSFPTTATQAPTTQLPTPGPTKLPTTAPTPFPSSWPTYGPGTDDFIVVEDDDACNSFTSSLVKLFWPGQ